MGKLGRGKTALALSVMVAAGVAGTACGTGLANGATGQHPAPLTTPTTVPAPPRWRIEPVPERAGWVTANLAAVSCPSTSECLATGEFGTTSSLGGMVERWNGTSWAIEHVPTPPSNDGVTLSGLSCPSFHACVLVGVVPVLDSQTKAFADIWNGSSWRLVTTPVPHGDDGTWLSSVSCVSSDDCVAVGDGEYVSQHYAMTATLAEIWNGSSWKLLQTPDPTEPAGGGNTLVSVSCATSTSCMAVGGQFGATDLVLSESWNGKAWTTHSAPTPNDNGGFDSVSCAAADACSAVVHSNSGPSTSGDVERWNGSSWSFQSTPVVSGGSLTGMSCATTTSCVAVGSRAGTDGASSTLAEKWNGATWAVVPTPDAVHGIPAPQETTESTGTVVPTDQNALVAVACSAPATCTAVGGDINGNAVGAALVERYSR